MAAKLSRRRPSPLTRANSQIWAASIVSTVGQVNFVPDPTRTPHLTTDPFSALNGGGQANPCRQVPAHRGPGPHGPGRPGVLPPGSAPPQSLAWMIGRTGWSRTPGCSPLNGRQTLAGEACSPTSLPRVGSEASGTTESLGIHMGITTKDALWAEAKKRCRLSAEAVRMAKEMGLNPRSLIKNIPSPSQPWKQPVEAWVRDIYAKQARRKQRPGKGPDAAAHSGGVPCAAPDPQAISEAQRSVEDSRVRARGYPIDKNIAPLVDTLNRFPGLRTFSSCGGHPPPLTVSQAPEGHYWVNFNVDPSDGGWPSLQALAYVVADLEEVTIKLWLAGDTPDTIAFELSAVGDPSDLTARLQAFRATSGRPSPSR